MKKKLQNFWYYHKIHVIIVLAVLGAGIYFLVSREKTVSDYDIAILSARGISDEQRAEIQRALEQAGTDQNGDGRIAADLHVYRFAIGQDGQDMNAVAALDADLVGKMSGLFFLDDPEAFETSTNGLGKAGEAVPVSGLPALSGCGIDDLYMLVRSEAGEKYEDLEAALLQ